MSETPCTDYVHLFDGCASVKGLALSLKVSEERAGELALREGLELEVRVGRHAGVTLCAVDRAWEQRVWGFAGRWSWVPGAGRLPPLYAG